MKIKIGTRRSPLAMVQTRLVAALLAEAVDGVETELVPMNTRGDRSDRIALWKIGGKGLFVQELEQALASGAIDIAVHSMKDLPADTNEAFSLGAVPVREDPRDTLIFSRRIQSIRDLPQGAVVGTSSLRRKAQLLSQRPDLVVTPLRGNVGTRMEKVEKGECDATLLAAAGMRRLGIDPDAYCLLAGEDFIPAAGQGALAVEVRRGDEGLVDVLDHRQSRITALSERAFVTALGADCRSAVGAYARIEDGTLTITGMVSAPNGSRIIREEESGHPDHFEDIGKKLAETCLGQGADTLLSMHPEG
ncbi:MAG: hydroxymethylbilane synthase [Deltaproteobacteria bacterium]|nr:hydroxymethylbilane synthase [Candidatus Zymogenaceae bacterium]